MTMAPVRGMKDILPPDSSRWSAVESAFRAHATAWGYDEIRTPILERTELFCRSVGETTDIVEKEMYSFADRSGDSLAMRPEGTAPVVRALLSHPGEFAEWPVRLFYIGPMFRHERPQKGRLRQFHQLGVELFGTDSPYADAEVLALLYRFLFSMGLSSVSLEVNSLGDPTCRPAFHDDLTAFLRERSAQLCDDCRRRLEVNPLRVLDCKNERCAAAIVGAPSMLDSLCGDCRDHFETVESALRKVGVPFVRNPRMVRGLDYYRRTTFEFVIPGMGAQNTVAAGGRYDGLAELIGGKQRVPALGFAIGLERLLMLMEASGPPPADSAKVDAFIVAGSPSFLSEAFRWKDDLATLGLRAAFDYDGRSMKSQFRRADKSGTRAVIVLGEQEAAQGLVGYRDMLNGTQENITEREAKERLLGRG